MSTFTGLSHRVLFPRQFSVGLTHLSRRRQQHVDTVWLGAAAGADPMMRMVMMTTPLDKYVWNWCAQWLTQTWRQAAPHRCLPLFFPSSPLLSTSNNRFTFFGGGLQTDLAARIGGSSFPNLRRNDHRNRTRRGRRKLRLRDRFSPFGRKDHKLTSSVINNHLVWSSVVRGEAAGSVKVGQPDQNKSNTTS